MGAASRSVVGGAGKKNRTLRVVGHKTALSLLAPPLLLRVVFSMHASCFGLSFSCFLFLRFEGVGERMEQSVNTPVALMRCWVLLGPSFLCLCSVCSQLVRLHNKHT